MNNTFRTRNKMFSFSYYNQYHLRYFLQLEKELESIGEYIEFDKKNYNTFSLIILKLYQAVCSQIDAISKIIAYLIDESFDYDGAYTTIKKTWYKIQNEKIGNVKLQEIRIKFNKNDDFIPFSKFEYELNEKKNISLKSKMKTPDWWIQYNKVKHCRPFFTADSKKTYFSYANIDNLLYSFSALFVLMLLYEQIIECKPSDSVLNKSNFFECCN